MNARILVLTLAGMLTAGGVLLPGNASAVEAKSSRPAASKVIRATLFALDFENPCGPPRYPGTLRSVVLSGAPKGRVALVLGPAPPLISREAVEYSIVGTSGETSLPTARILAQVRGGGELSFKSDRGKNVVLQVDAKSVCWDIDQEEVLMRARAYKTRHALVAVLHAEDLTAEANPNGEMGRQKSVSVSVEMTLLQADDGTLVGSYSGETRVMDLSVREAIRRGAASLVTKGFQELLKDE